MTQVLARAAVHDDLVRMSMLWYEHAALLAQQDTRWVLRSDALAYWIETVRRLLDDPRVCVRVTSEEDHLTGYLIVALEEAPVGFHPERVGVVHSMAVDAHQHSSGAASLLLSAAKQWCREHGVEQVVVDVPKRAVIQQAFWRAQGGLPWTERLWIP